MTEVYATNKYYPVGTAHPKVGDRIRSYFPLAEKWDNGTIVEVTESTYSVNWDFLGLSLPYPITSAYLSNPLITQP